MDTLRRIAAYLVEHERIDGETFDELFDGTIEVPDIQDEADWRPTTSRPREWGEIAAITGTTPALAEAEGAAEAEAGAGVEATEADAAA